MEYAIRELQKNEYPVLDDFLYEAIFIPEGVFPVLFLFAKKSTKRRRDLGQVERLSVEPLSALSPPKA